MNASARSAPTLASLGLRIGIVAAGALILANAVLAWIALGAVERRLEPVVEEKARVLARSIANDLATAVRLDIPIADLSGVGAYLDDVLADHPETAYVAVTDEADRVLFSAAAQGHGIPASRALGRDAGHGADADSTAAGPGFNFVHPLTREGEPVAMVMIGVDRRYVRDTMGSIFADIGISLFVAVLITLELTLLVLSLAVVRSIGQMQRLMRAVAEGDFSLSVVTRGRDDLNRVLDAMNRVNAEINRRFNSVAARATPAALAKLRQGRIFAESGRYRPVQVLRAGDVQYPLFFFIFGVELSRSFFPLFVRDLYDPSLGIDPSIAIALPMSVWVVAMLLTTPLVLTAIRRWGVRETLLIGMAPTSIGLMATAYAGGFIELIAWRCVTAAGFGLVTAAILVRLATMAQARRRALNIGVFVTAIGGGSVCGTAIGGILADHIGYQNTFLVGAVIVFVAMAITLGFLSPGEGAGTGPDGHSRRRGSFRIYASPKFIAFMGLSALPSRIVLVGFLFFLVPLYLDALGFSGAAIGRTMMVYFVVLLVMNQAAALIADRFQNHGLLILAGGVSASAGCLLFVSTADVLRLVIAIALIGLGQSLVMTPQVAVLPVYFLKEVKALGAGAMTEAFRVVERAGSIAGPLVAGVVVAATGLEQAGRLIGYGALVMTGLLAVLMAARVFSPRR